MVIGIYGVVLFKSSLREMAGLYQSKDNTSLYLPEAKYIRLITFGFERFTADIFWFKAINYFGKELSANKNAPWLSHMCDLVTDLNPRAQEYYDFCTSLISWVTKEPEKSVKLLNRAIANEPENWRYYYLGGFNYWYFLENNKKAKSDFQIGARTHDAPEFMANLASRLTINEDDPSVTIGFLQNLIEQTRDEKAREALAKNLKLAVVSRDLKYLNSSADKFEILFGTKITSLQDLVDYKLIAFLPKDPYGELYYVKDHEIISKKGKKGLKFHGLTVKTGLAKNEQ